jgi:hypothetical protein
VASSDMIFIPSSMKTHLLVQNVLVGKGTETNKWPWYNKILLNKEIRLNTEINLKYRLGNL